MASATKQHRVVVIGTGSIGERHTRCFQHTNRADVCICEIDATIRRRVQQTYDLKAAYEDFEQVLATESGIAVICTPAQMHVPMALRLVERGFDVLLEKPVSTGMDRVSELVLAIEKSNAKCGVAYVLRASPVMQKVKQLLDGGELGDLVEVVAVGGQHFPTYRPAYREIYYTERATGGGAVQDALTHWVNAVQWYAGPMDHVAADCDRLVLEGVNTEDSVNAIARHGDVMVNYSLNQHQAPNEIVFRFVCRKGVVEVVSHEQICRVQRGPEQPWETVLAVNLERDETFVVQANRFLDYVEGTQSPACSLTEGVETLRANLAILQAADSRQWVSIER